MNRIPSCLGNSVLFLLIAAASNAMAFQQPPDKPSPRTNASLLAAVESLREIIKAERFAIPPDKLREVVLAYLRANPAPLPRVMPSADELQKDLNVTFDASWNEMLKRASAGLDATVAEELTRFLQDNHGLRDSAKSNYDRSLQHDLPKALANVHDTLVQEQQQALLETLRSTVSTNLPSPQQIVEAKATDATATTQVLRDEVVAKLPDDLRPTILAEAYEALQTESRQVVEDGVMQFSEQLDALTKQPTAVVASSIQNELEERITQLVAKQKDARNGNPLRPAYGAFTDQLNIPGEARSWFDKRVAKAGSDRMTKVAGDKTPFSEADTDALKQLILAEPATHHDPVRSLQNAEMRQTINSRLDAKKEWIVDEMQEARKRSADKRDQDVTEEEFARSVLDCLDAPNSVANDAWQQLRGLLQRRCEGELLKSIRDGIAADEAKRFAPELANDSWQITEPQRRELTLPLTPSRLKALPVWSNGPPQPDESVLREAWEIWTDAAMRAVALFDRAEIGQHDVVNGLSNEIRETIQQALAAGDKLKSQDDWLAAVRDRVTAKWRESNRDEAKAYPELFETTLTMLRGLIATILREEPAKPESKPQPDANPEMISPAPIPRPDTPPLTNPPPDPSQTPTPPSPEPEGKGPGMGGEDLSKSESSDEGDKPGGEGGDQSGEGDADGQKKKPPQGDMESDREKSGIDEEETVVPKSERLLNEAEVERVPVQPRFSDWFFRIAFFVLLMLVVLMALGWFWHVRYLRGLLAQRDRMGRVR